MPLAPFAPRPAPGEDQPRRARLAVALALVGIGAALLAYVISPSVRHAVKRAARSLGHAVTHVFKGNERRTAPALPTEVLVRPRVTLASLRGRSALVTFWDAACPGCTREARSIEKFAIGAAGRGRVVGVNSGDTRSHARAFVRHYRWTFPNLRDGDGAVGRRYGVKNARELPVTYVIDKTGHIAATLRGPLTDARMTAGLKTGSG
jgi:peroxiredoxin